LNTHSRHATAAAPFDRILRISWGKRELKKERAEKVGVYVCVWWTPMLYIFNSSLYHFVNRRKEEK